jgi:hypothetical protein
VDELLQVVVDDGVTLWTVVSTDEVYPLISEMEIGKVVWMMVDKDAEQMVVQDFGHSGLLGRLCRQNTIE